MLPPQRFFFGNWNRAMNFWVPEKYVRDVILMKSLNFLPKVHSLYSGRRISSGKA